MYRMKYVDTQFLIIRARWSFDLDGRELSVTYFILYMVPYTFYNASQQTFTILKSYVILIYPNNRHRSLI